jgi:hypothetical protein
MIGKAMRSCLVLLDATPDGCAEVALDVNGHFLASTVIVTGDPDWYGGMIAWYRAEVRRRC